MALKIFERHLAREICPVTIPQKKGDPVVVSQDEHPRETSLEALAKLKGRGSRDDGNASKPEPGQRTGALTGR